MGDPRVQPGILERDLLLRIRFALDQYVNLRPVIRYPGVQTLVPSHTEDDVNFVVVRENSEGLYTGTGGFHRKGTPHEVAVQESINTRHGVERIVRYAFDVASNRRKHLTLVHKTNVLTFAGDLYQRVVDEVAAEFPNVQTDYVHVDAACIYFLDQPSRFDVIVTDNMFGDIITDLGAMIQGGIGVAAGANIAPDGVSMFEPIGGTAPDHAGKIVGIVISFTAGVVGKLLHDAARRIIVIGVRKIRSRRVVRLHGGHASCSGAARDQPPRVHRVNSQVCVVQGLAQAFDIRRELHLVACIARLTLGVEANADREAG